MEKIGFFKSPSPLVIASDILDFIGISPVEKLLPAAL
jgi:hypothetical protein